MKQQPLRHSAAYLRECVDVLSADPPDSALAHASAIAFSRQARPD